MRAYIFLAALGLLAACKTVEITVPPAMVPVATLAVTLPAGTDGSVAATEALLPKVVEDYCLTRLIDGVPESFAVAKAGLTPAVNPINGVDQRFPRDAWSTPGTPRFYVWPSSTGGAGCTIAIFEGDFTRAIRTMGDTIEAGSARRGSRAPGTVKKLPTYEQIRLGWRTFFAPGRDGRMYTVFASHDNLDPNLSRGLVMTISELNKQ